MRYLLAFALLSLAVPARAEGPAVSEVNGKVSVESGVTGAFGRSSAVGTLQGAITAPIGHSFGVELDGFASTSRNVFSGGGLVQFFWRDPELGMAGPFAGLAGSSGARLALLGGMGELFGRNVTLQGFGGYVDVASGSALPGAYGALYGGRLTLYPDPNLAISIGGASAIGRASGSAQVEYLPDLTPRRNLSFFVSAGAGDNQSYRVTGGIRLYFGPTKSLIRRHREDDPSYSDIMTAMYDPMSYPLPPYPTYWNPYDCYGMPYCYPTPY